VLVAATVDGVNLLRAEQVLLEHADEDVRR
jgi:hypothetical protein